MICGTPACRPEPLSCSQDHPLLLVHPQVFISVENRFPLKSGWRYILDFWSHDHPPSPLLKGSSNPQFLNLRSRKRFWHLHFSGGKVQSHPVKAAGEISATSSSGVRTRAIVHVRGYSTSRLTLPLRAQDLLNKDLPCFETYTNL